jgi:hypothetical protein
VDAQTARAHAAALDVAYEEYLTALGRSTSVQPCAAPWPPSMQDVAPARCELLEGHTHRDGTHHRHRIGGSQVIVEWE